MDMNESKNRQRISSVTAEEDKEQSSLQGNLSPIQKPEADPDTPPELSLEDNLGQYHESHLEKKEENKNGDKVQRTKSHDSSSYSILGFIQKKIHRNNQRLLSAEFDSKVALEQKFVKDQ